MDIHHAIQSTNQSMNCWHFTHYHGREQRIEDAGPGHPWDWRG